MSQGPAPEQSRFGRWFAGRIPFFYANWITSLGSVLALVAVALLFAALIVHIVNVTTERHTNPYVDMITFMLLPGLLAFGFALVGIGTVIERRRRGGGEEKTVAIQVGGAAFMRKAMLVGFLALLAMILFGSFGYEAYHYTDSTDFCMKVCHEVMEPEGVAYGRSPHANVACVKCHIGPGADWFVKAKISGLRQVVAVMTDDFSRPIPAPVHNLRPARDTCEACHWPEHFHGSQLIVREHTEPDEENTPSVTAVVLKVGGIAEPGRRSTGVHWHVDPGNEVRYRAVDEKREKIVEVVQTTPDGEVRYLSEDAGEFGDEGEWRVMDCIDCHNRPTHIYELPYQAVDAAFQAGDLDASVPWLRAVAERILFEHEPTDDTAADLAAAIADVYRQDHPEALEAVTASLDATAAVLADILERNIFPAMNITWNTYPNHIGHMGIDGDYSETGGCFRCHDEMHESEDGRVISQDCDACHNIVAERETELDDLPDFVSAVLSR